MHENIQNYIANYEIGHDTFIENVDIILVDGVSKFGNGVEVSVLNETGGREVLINVNSPHTKPIFWRFTAIARS